MDNSKTGLFIREMRKEKNMTQKDLAAQLNITDRAVSKWERGLCAPDISLLEPLSQILGCSAAEIISGEKQCQSLSPIPSADTDSTKTIIDYSLKEINRKVSLTKKRYTAGIISAAAVILAAVFFFIYAGGYFNIIDKVQSPDGRKTVTVYDRPLDKGIFSAENSTFIITRLDKETEWRVSYGECEYEGLWWSPDSQKYVLMLGYPDETRLTLSWLERNSESNLSAYLSMGVEMSELSKYGYITEDGWPRIDYQFLQWAEDSESMLIYYSFDDTDGKLHSGYFWYNCTDCTVSAVLEMNSGKA